MNGWRALCPAKVNLGLRVLGRRGDGFHEIVTIFQTIDLEDVLTLEPAEALSLTASDPGLPVGDSNLVIQAARLLQSHVEGARGRGAKLALHKAIPIGGGLGGGSSDAAGALMLLNEVWRLGLERSALTRFAAALGSDVPFFLSGGTALGTGRGEVVEPLPPVVERTVLLGIPPFGLRTAEVYRTLDAPLTVPGADVTVRPLFVKLAEGNDFALAKNDLEGAAFRLRVELVAFRDALARSGAEAALLSGSGSTVFGVFGAETDLTSRASDLRDEFPDWTVRACRTSARGVRILPAVA
jgi:4-diphosphocytidyl-2-C-methyl-D-erythritol kinase